MPPSSSTTDVEKELYLLNHCLANAEQVHFFVSNSLLDSTGKATGRSVLLNDDNQEYLAALLDKYSKSIADRKQLQSGAALYYLECLTDPAVREDFITLAASSLFPATSPGR